ncbi:MAG: hypothetical protein ACLQVX_18685 [Limisphaerales bacterium]
MQSLRYPPQRHRRFPPKPVRDHHLCLIPFAVPLSIPEEWKERFLAKIETWEADENQTNQAQVDRIKAELAALKVKIDRINNAFTEGAMELQVPSNNPLIYWLKRTSPFAISNSFPNDIQDGGAF